MARFLQYAKPLLESNKQCYEKISKIQIHNFPSLHRKVMPSHLPISAVRWEVDKHSTIDFVFTSAIPPDF